MSSTARRSLGWLVPILILGAAVWTMGASLDIAGHGAAIVRVAMLPSLWGLAACLSVALACGFVLTRWGFSPALAAPLSALGLVVVPFLPWIADALPALRAAGGPARGAIFFVVAWLIVCSLGPLVTQRVKPTAGLVFVLSLAVFGGVAWRLGGSGLFPGGDEPHYLIITQSLIYDGDLKIENNHQAQQYRQYFSRDLAPDYLTRGVDGAIYSVHPIGLPILAVPAFAIAGYWGVVTMLVLMAALAATIFWTRAREVAGEPEAATFAWASVALTTPFLFNSFTVFPEIPGALAVMIALAWRVESTSLIVLLARGLAVAALPWLSTKYAPMAAIVALIVVLRSIRDARSFATFALPIVVSLAGWFEFFHAYWGTYSPSAPYGSQHNMALSFLARGGLGLLFDQEYGVVAFAPVLVIAIGGLVGMLASSAQARARALEVIAVFGTLLATVGAFHLWWGGSGSPGRPVVSGILLLGLPIAWASARVRSVAHTAWRALFHALLAASLAIAFMLATTRGGALINNERDGRAALLQWMSPAWPLWPVFPDYVLGSVVTALARTALWLGLLGVTAMAIRAFKPRTFGTAALGVLGVASMGAVVVASTTSHVRPASPDTRARVPLFDDFDATARPIGIVYEPFSRVAPNAILARMALTAKPGQNTAPQPLNLLWNARFGLPPGEYRLTVTREAKTPTTIALQIGRSGEPRDTWPIDSTLDQRFVLPVDAVFVGFRVPPNFGNGTLTLTPIRIVDQRDRLDGPEVSRVGTYGNRVVYVHDTKVVAEPDGFWTLGGRSLHLTIVAPVDDPDALDIPLRCGPISNQVQLVEPGWRQMVSVDAGRSATVKIPMPRREDLAARVAALDISVRDGFVPSEIDHASNDSRKLGCWFVMR